MKRKKLLLVLLILVPLLALLVSLLSKSYAVDSKDYSPVKDINYNETLESFDNPERGFYTPLSYTLTTNNNTTKTSEANLVHLRVGLSAFTKANNGKEDLELTEDALKALDTTLKNIKKNGGSVIIRFAYDDFKGTKDVEPSLDMILKHIKQLKTIFYNNSDVITYVELGFFGPSGEMHSSQISTVENVSKAIDEMLNSVPKDISIGVRQPKYYTYWANVDRSALDKNITTKDTKYYRVGLYNDGYLGSKNDLGTFENRDIETKWLSYQAKHTLYGGEVTETTGDESPINTIDYIAKEGFVTHTSYLNSEYNRTVLNKWKAGTYTGSDSVYNGQTGYKYIENHLGYRYVLKESELTKTITTDDILKLKFKIHNVGFGNLVNPKITSFILQNDKNTYEIKTQIDARNWQSNMMTTVTYETTLPKDIVPGEYKVYLRISQKGDYKTDNNYKTIRLANEKIWNEKIGANYIGTTKISKGTGTAPAKTIKIESTCGVTAQAIETFYEDENYKYQFNSIKSGCIYVTVNDKKYTVKEALNQKVVTIDELSNAGLKFNKVSKNTTSDKNIKIEDRCQTTAQAVETFYKDDKYQYQFSSIKSDCTYAIVNNKEYKIKDALNQKIITIEEAEKAGLKFGKITLNAATTTTIISNQCDITAQAIETFYEDENYKYQFNSIQSGCIYATINGKKYTVKEALNQKLITINDLERAGIKFNKIKKETTQKPEESTEKLNIINRCGVVAQTIETFYEDENYKYQFNSMRSSCTYAVIDKKEYPIKEALNQKLITIEEAESAGLTFNKIKKENQENNDNNDDNNNNNNENVNDNTENEDNKDNSDNTDKDEILTFPEEPTEKPAEDNQNNNNNNDNSNDDNNENTEEEKDPIQNAIEKDEEENISSYDNPPDTKVNGAKTIITKKGPGFEIIFLGGIIILLGAICVSSKSN